MTTALIPQLFLAPVAAVQRVLDQFGQQGVIIGGIAVSILGKPRTTADVDAVVIASVDDLSHLMMVAQQEGLSPRVENAEEFARRRRVLLLRHDASGITVDISLGVLPFEIETVERSQLVQTGELQIRLPTPEDLIIQKAVAHRPMDLDDIRTIIVRQPKLDWQRIEYWISQFAEVLEMPELWTNIADLRKQAKPRKRRK